LNVIVSGSTGLIGQAVCLALQVSGHSVRRLVRAEAIGRDIAWDIPSAYLDTSKLSGVDAAINLAGEGVAAKRWSKEQKHRILSSRVEGTTLLAKSLAEMDVRPKVLLSGSAIGYYGSRGDEVLTEESESGTGFLAEVCRQWEAATAPAEAAGIRVVHLRTGIVLSKEGGALKKQLPLFQAGVGGKLASGSQWTSWITIIDEVGAILHALTHEDISGPLNLTAPNPVTNKEFTKALAAAVHRPAVIPVPKAALGVVLGRELAGDLTASQRVQPKKLEQTGYRFHQREIEAALAKVLA
jgi:uncharacterized protein (TIGR01777 family)